MYSRTQFIFLAPSLVVYPISLVLIMNLILQINLRILTDSEEDMRLIYNKLISGIPDLNQRVLGK